MKLKYNLKIIILTLALASSALAEDKKTTETASPSAKGSDKMDLKKLEDKYWSSKDDDYGVIQNRTFSKTGKLYLSAVYGPLINDQFNVISNFNSYF